MRQPASSSGHSLRNPGLNQRSKIPSAIGPSPLARAAAIRAGFDEDEDTVTIDLSDREETENVEISIDLSTTTSTLGALWDPIPVTPATYVSQPLLPRTVRTIDLAAPVAPTAPLVPTADHPADVVVDEESLQRVRETKRVLKAARKAVASDSTN